MRPFKLLAALLTLAVLLSACTAKPDGPDPRTSVQSETVRSTAEQEPSGSSGTASPDSEDTGTMEYPDPVFPELPPVVSAESYDALLARLNADLEQAGDAIHSPVLPEEDPGGDPGAEDPGGSRSVEGVWEASPVCTDGSLIYLLDSYGLTILSAEGKNSSILSYTQVRRQSESGSGSALTEGLYVWQDRVAVLYSLSDFGTDEQGNWFDVTATHAVLLDVSDPSDPSVIADTAVDGTCRASRMVDGMLYIVTTYRPARLSGEGEDPALIVPCVIDGSRDGRAREQLPPEDIYLSPNNSGVCFTVAATVSMKDGSVGGALAFTDAADAVCMDRNGLYLARGLRSVAQSEPRQEGPYTVISCVRRLQTEIKRLGRSEDGSLRFSGSTLIPGGVVSQNAMDLYNGCLRIATVEENRGYGVYTDEAHGWTNYALTDPDWRSGVVTVLDQELNELGSLSGLLLEGRRFSDCRYLDNALCLIPSVEMEPMVIVDLSSPDQPSISGELDLPAASLSLRSFGPDLLLGFGSAWPAEGLQLRMFRYSDSGLKEADSRSLPSYFYSAAISDDRDLLLAPELGLVGFPAEGSGLENYAVYAYEAGAFSERGALSLAYLPAETFPVLADGLLYLCSTGVTYVVDLDTLDLLASVSSAEG